MHILAAYKKDAQSHMPLSSIRPAGLFPQRADFWIFFFFLSILPSAVFGRVARINDELDVHAAFVAPCQRAGEELVVARAVGGRAGEEILSLEGEGFVVDGESVEVGSGGCDAGVGLGEGDGAVGGDVGLLAAGDFDVLRGWLVGARIRGALDGE